MFFYDLSKMEILAISITITMVIMAELINTAIEFAVDATTNYYHPLGKLAKNVAAGGVLSNCCKCNFGRIYNILG